MKPEQVKILGIYLIAICILQIWLYLAMSFVDMKENLWLLYLEPRIGIVVVVELFVRVTQPMVVMGVLRAFLVVWTLALGVLMLSGRPLIKTYIISEIIISFPSLLCFLALVVIIAVNFNSAPKYQTGMLLIPIPVAVFFTVIPLVMAFGLLLSSLFKRETKVFE